jgi:glycosyltransferase involved in cell wall biosynthesis
VTPLRASVVIPSYNHETYVEEAVRSVLASPVDGLELVVVDDGSRDESVERLERFRADPRFRLYVQENRGAHAALNRGVELSGGEVVFLLNSDDLFAERRIPRLLERFDADPELVLAASWLEVIDGDGSSLGVKRAWRNMLPWPRPEGGPGLAETGDAALALLETNYVSTTSNAAFRRRLFDDGVRFQPLRYAHDWDFLLEAAARGRFELVEEPLVSYRVHTSNTIREGEKEREAQGQMRFEILWVVARHAERILSRRGAAEDAELRRRMRGGLPRFGYASILSQLLVQRGADERPPASYDALLDPRHPFRRAAVRLLGEESA